MAISSRRRGVHIPIVLAASALAACGGGDGGTTAPPSHVAVYSFTHSALVAADSLKYAGSNGSLVTVVGPSGSWTATVGVPAGSAIEARVWAHSTGSSQTATLKVEWVPQAGGAVQRDSAFAAISAPGQFGLTIPRRAI